jgi:CBS domain-containing protein
MSSKVSDWMSSPAIVIDPDSSVSYALTLMRRRNIHSLVVDLSKEQDVPTYGIVTTTDIRDKIMATERNPAETSVRDIMSFPALAASPDWSLKDCSMKMQQHNIHHLLVVGENGMLLGLISATDIFIAAEEIGWGKGT